MKIKANRFITAVFFCLFSLWYCYSTPSLEPSVKITFENNNLTPHQIIETALEYSLCPAESSEGQICLKKYEAMERTVLRRFGQLPQIEAAEQVLQFMYEGFLFKYVEHSTKLNTTLVTGEYNCVTASVLYLALTQALGIDSRGQETPLHAFITVYIDGTPVDVETTNPYGFNPGVKKVVEQTENSRRFSYVTKKYYAGRREVSLKSFATLSGKNLAADLNDVNDYETAIPLDLSRLVFLKGDSEEKTARSDVDVLAANYVLTLNKQHNADESVRWLNQLIELYGKSDETQRIYDNTVYNGVVDLLNLQNDSQARQWFEANRYNISPKNDAAIDSMITKNILHRHEVETHNSIVPLFNKGKYQEAKEILEQALQKNPDSATLKKDMALVKRALGQ